MPSFIKYIILSSFLISCSSPKVSSILNVSEALIFTKQEFAGNIQVDENGNPLQKGYWLQHFLVVEIMGDALPKWESLEINGKQTVIKETEISDSVLLGKEKNSSNKIILFPKKGGKLMLLKFEDHFSEVVLQNSQFFLIGKLKDKTIKFLIEKEPIWLENELRP